MKPAEFGLVAGVVRQALNDHFDNVKTFGVAGALRNMKRDHENNAALWILSDDDDAWSFLWCCDLLDLSPNKVRAEMNTCVLKNKIFSAEVDLDLYRNKHPKNLDEIEKRENKLSKLMGLMVSIREQEVAPV